MNKEITDYYMAKKRQLSSQSEDGDDPKKICNEPTIIDEVFKEGLQNPDCVAILLHCLRNLEIQVNTIFTESTESKDSRIKGEKHLQDLNASITCLTKKFNDYEEERKEKDKIIENLQNNNVQMEKKIEDLERKVDRQEQYSRRNCILIHGIPESPNEDTDTKVIDTIKEHLDISITEEDIDRSHRLGKRSTNQQKSRPIIVKLVRYNTRRKIFYNKKKLKGKKLSITESLTKKRMEYLKKAQDEKEFRNVWSSDGRIMYKNDNNEATVYYD